MKGEDREGGGQDQPGADDRPGALALRGVKLEQEEAGYRENQARGREHIDEQAPYGARVAPLVQIVEIGDPAAVGDFAGRFAGCAVDRDPRIAARTRRREIGLVGRPFGVGGGADGKMILHPRRDGGGKGGVAAVR